MTKTTRRSRRGGGRAAAQPQSAGGRRTADHRRGSMFITMPATTRQSCRRSRSSHSRPKKYRRMRACGRACCGARAPGITGPTGSDPHRGGAHLRRKRPVVRSFHLCDGRAAGQRKLDIGALRDPGCGTDAARERAGATGTGSRRPCCRHVDARPPRTFRDRTLNEITLGSSVGPLDLGSAVSGAAPWSRFVGYDRQ